MGSVVLFLRRTQRRDFLEVARGFAKAFLLCGLTGLLAACKGGGDEFNFAGDNEEPPPVTVVQTPDLTVLVHSQVTVTADTVSSGGSITVRLQIRRDSASGPVDWALTGQTVSFFHSGGTSRGTFGATSDMGGGLYTATFTGSQSGSTTQIYAIIESFGQVNDTADVTVLPGALSLARTTLSVVPTSLFAGASGLVTLTTRDANMNLMGSAGSGRTVVFSVASGAGLSGGTFSPVSDNADGTYTSYFTGSVAGGAVTVSATVNGSAITSTLPTVQVLPAPPPSDLSYLTFSQVTVSSPTVNAGTTATVTLSVRVTDGMGGSVPVITGGLNVLFFNTGGTSTGTISAVTDNNDGTYTATFTGNTAGTATTIRAIISGYGLVDDTALLTVQPGALSLAHSTVSVSPPSIFSGSTAIFALQTRDAYGNALGVAGAGRSVTFSLQAGIGLSQGTIGLATDMGDGTYQSIFTGTTTGAAAAVTGFVNSAPVTTTAPTVLVLSSPAPVLNSVSDRTFESGSPLVAGDTLSIDFYNTNTNDDAGMGYLCHFDRTFDGTYGQACSALPGSSASFSSSTGLLTWNTSASATWGAFAFRVQGTKGGLTDTRYFSVNVRQPYDTTDLRVDLDANFARDRSKPPRNSSPAVTTWTNVNSSGTSYDGLLCGSLCNLPNWLMTSGSGWAGTGASSSPFRLNFNGTNGVLDAGANLQDANLVISLWARFGAIASTTSGSVVFTNTNTSGAGITFKQSRSQQGRVIFLTGQEEEYSRLVLEELGGSLQGYWRMSDSNGTSPLYDSCITCNQGLTVGNTARVTYQGGGSAVADPGDVSHRFNQGGNTYVRTDFGSKLGVNDYSIETWIYTPVAYNTGGVIFNTADVPNGEGTNCSRMLWMNTSGTVTYQVFPDVDVVGDIRSQAVRLTSASALNTAQWHHVVVTHKVSTDPAQRRVRLFVNGVETAASTAVSGLYNQGSANRYFKIGNENTDSNPGGYQGNRTCDSLPMNNQGFSGWLDEVAVYTKVLSEAEVRARYRVGRNGVCRVGPIADNTWYHFGIAFSGGKSQVYMARPGTDSDNLTPDCDIDAGSLMVGSPAGNTNFFIGSGPNGTDVWNGAVGDFKVYDSEFTEAPNRINSVYQTTRSRFP